MEQLDTRFHTRPHAINQTPPKHKGRGGIEHTHYCHWICMVGNARGYKAQIEVLAPGTDHPTDVMWWIRDELWAFECVSRCEQNIISHLQACLIESDAISIVTIVAPQKRILESVKKSVRCELSLAPVEHKIRCDVVEEYMKELWS